MNIDWIALSPQSGTAGENIPVGFQLIAENDTFADKTIRVRSVCGNKSALKTIILKGKTYPVGTVFGFDYTGAVQEVLLPAGKYKLQCWGAQGGNVSGSYTAQGSKGGYSEGVLKLDAATTLYIFVGGKGTDSSTSSTSGTVNGGWNGGGGSVRQSSYNSGDTNGMSYPRPGGGATDIALVTSNMSYLSYRNNRSAASLLSRIIVAGGGAGASAYKKDVATTTDVWIEDHRVEMTWESSWIADYKSVAYSGATSYSFEAGVQYRLRVAEDNYSGLLLAYYNSNGSGISYINPWTPTNTYNNIKHYIFSTNNYIGQSVTLIVERYESTTSTSTSSGQSNAAQQGGGTSGLGISPGTQNSGGGGEFGKGANQTTTNYRYDSGAGGGGWYGGGSSHSDSSTSQINASGGGSGFVNTAANAANRPSGYTGLQLESGETKAGNTSFPSTGSGNETGHSGNGYARITVLGDGDSGGDTGGGTSASINWATQSGTWNEKSNSSAADGKQFTCVSPGSGGSTVIRCTFSGVSSITFRCRYQGESNYDYLTVGYLDSACTRSSYGTTLKGTTGTWKNITFTPSRTGTHYVEFCYSKDGSVDTSPDNADVYIESYN